MAQAHILVVDDEPDIRQLVSEILEDEGYRVTTADNGESARSAFARDTPDLVLLDIWMPDVDGITLLKEWSGGSGLKCPVIVMSGHGTVETAVEATRLGAQDFVQKPLSLARLLAVVSQALAAKRPAGESSRRTQAALAVEPVGSSPAMQLLRGKAEQAAQHDSPVLITGEKGSGRESLARFIHARSGRRGEFVSADRQYRQQSSQDRKVLRELDRLAGGGEIPVKDDRRRDEEEDQGKRPQPREVPQEDREASAKLEEDGEDEEERRHVHPHARHIGLGLREYQELVRAGVQEDARQQDAGYEQPYRGKTLHPSTSEGFGDVMEFLASGDTLKKFKNVPK